MMTPLAPPGINRRSQWHQEMLVELHEILLRLRDAPRLELYAPRDEFPPVGGEAVNSDGRNELTSEEIEIAEIEEALRRLRSGTYGCPDGVPGPVR